MLSPNREGRAIQFKNGKLDNSSCLSRRALKEDKDKDEGRRSAKERISFAGKVKQWAIESERGAVLEEKDDEISYEKEKKNENLRNQINRVKMVILIEALLFFRATLFLLVAFP